MSQPSSPTKPKRRNSLKEQWDTTTKVVNVKQKFHSSAADKYTELQKATFTKWVNIQLRMIDINQLNNSSSTSSPKKIPEIKAIGKDFRDGKKLIQLLEILYPNDSELPKLERGKTRHHYIANVNKVLEFLQKRLDERGLIALKAIGAVDIVDGNVKLTLGLIWLTISKFLQIFSVQFEVTEEELEQVEEIFKENINNGDVNEIGTFKEFQQQFRSHFVENVEDLSQKTSAESPPPIPSLPTVLPNKRLQDLSKSEKRLSLPIFQSNLTVNTGKGSSNCNPKQFRTLRLNSSPINSNTSNLLFWINMQLIHYAPILPSSNYPLEDFIGLNDGIVLAALIQYLNIEWKMEDLNLLNPDDIQSNNAEKLSENLSEEELYERELYKELQAKERLSKCFGIIEKKLNIQRPRALVSMLIEKGHNDKERLKRTGLAWSIYISEIFLAITKSKNQRKELKKQSRLLMLTDIEENNEGEHKEEKKGKEKPKEHIIKIIDYDAIHYQSPSNNNQKKHKKSRGCLPFFYTSDDDNSSLFSPASSLITMIWDWTLNWLLTDDENDDDEMGLIFGVV